jgi:hypothetical protein
MKALAAILLCLVLSLTLPILPAAAQHPLNLTITPSGDVVPSTDLLERNGATYTFKGDIFGSITVQKAGITIDGAGYTLEGNRQAANMRGINLVGQNEAFNAYGKVSVKNLRIYNFVEGIYTPSNNNSFIGNFFDNARLHIIGGSGTGNLVKHNVFSSTEIFVDYNNGGDDVITENNFFGATVFVDIAMPPLVDRNYWSNYTANYPDAKEVDGTGVWDTPYDYDMYVHGSHGNYTCFDQHPLVNPVSTESLFFSNPTPTAPSTAATTPPITSGNQPFTSLLIGAIVVAVAVGLAAAILLKKRQLPPASIAPDNSETNGSISRSLSI